MQLANWPVECHALPYSSLLATRPGCRSFSVYATPAACQRHSLTDHTIAKSAVLMTPRVQPQPISV